VIYIDTVMQYHLSLPDPDALSDEDWAMKYFILLEIIKAENKTS
jgi:hypothetical protein